ncbi:MAG: class IV adenylate cyclase [Spirochaetaceae bacterium]|jgi:adenylate cyclase class 2|nr:class IV adenylate cyclase [Spirochaetaceae bacterium]
MATEIELKAWVREPEALRERLNALAKEAGSFEKEDSYWYDPAGRLSSSGIRIRKETDEDTQGAVTRAVRVTYKHKEIRGSVEVNDEHEFSVSDDRPFEDLLIRLGFVRGSCKHKRGWSWDYAPVTAELSFVEGLGWFVELEILADSDRPEVVQAARASLLAALDAVGVGAEHIETRYYTEMLLHKRISAASGL